MENLVAWLVERGVSEPYALGLTIIAALLLSVLIGRTLKGFAHAPLDRFIKPRGAWSDALKRFAVPSRISWLIATVAAKALLLPLLSVFPAFETFAEKALDFALVIAVAASLSGLIAAAVYTLEHKDTRRRVPFKVLGQALQLAIWAYATVAILAVVTEKDLASVLTGLTAIGAILVYVFRDPILGWTAGVQIAANDLVAEGDWVSVPKYGADGIVEEITLTIVKVRNWDRTVSSIPTYSLFSEGFTNWRGMYQSGGRRITRSISLDALSVRFCDRGMIERLSRSPLVEGLDVLADDETHSDPISDVRPTNLGVFRAWLDAWLAQHPKIHKDMIVIVSEGDPGAEGMQIDISIFSTEQGVREYQRISAEIINHVLAVLPMFDLRIFQNPSGTDMRALSKS